MMSALRSKGSKPLAGVRVLDLTQMLAGPYGSLLLADMGADVVKIERPPAGDPARAIPPFVDGESTYFMSINRNKRSLVLDLSRETGRSAFFDLVRVADVVLDNFRPGVVERLGIDYPSLVEQNQRIIACSISAFGLDGPYRMRPAFDLVVQAMSGAMGITGEPGRPPVRMGLPMGDLGGGLFAVIGVLAALFERERTGHGRLVDVSLLDGLIGMLTYLASSYLATGQEPEPVGSAHHSVVPYQAFEASDGSLVVAIFPESFWVNLCGALGLEELMDDRRFKTNALRLDHREALTRILAAEFRKKPRDVWLRLLTEKDVPCGPVNTLGEALSDPQVIERGMLTTVNHPLAGAVRMARTPRLFDLSEDDRDRPPPILGQHSREVLQEIAGYQAERINALVAEGVVHE